MRHSLSDVSVRASTVVGSWAEQEGLIPEANIIQVFRDKAKCAGKRSAQGDREVWSEDD